MILALRQKIINKSALGWLPRRGTIARIYLARPIVLEVIKRVIRFYWMIFGYVCYWEKGKEEGEGKGKERKRKGKAHS